LQHLHLCSVAPITDEQAQQMAKGLAVTGDINAAADQIKRLYQLFASSDCTMVEVGLATCLTRLLATLLATNTLLFQSCVPVETGEPSG
jgi:succinyl-CoA synthetase beta subunit